MATYINPENPGGDRSSTVGRMYVRSQQHDERSDQLK